MKYYECPTCGRNTPIAFSTSTKCRWIITWAIWLVILLGAISVTKGQIEIWPSDELIVVTTTGCPPCDEMKKVVAVLKNDGYNTSWVPHTDPGAPKDCRRFPTLVFRTDGVEDYRGYGYMSVDACKKRLRAN